jgi:3-deoxy-7-phosphoheptulonate synthase
MEESARIKAVLLPKCAAIKEAMTEMIDFEMADARRTLGYAELFTPPNGTSLVDQRVKKEPMIVPRMLADVLPLSPRSQKTTYQGRKTLEAIHQHKDSRLIVALGECAVVVPEVTLDNTQNIRRWQARFPHLFLVQRTFFEKPRTPRKKNAEMPWKGFLVDPNRDGSDDINLGVIAARMLTSRVTDQGVPAIKEQLNALTPQFLDGMIVQDNIGARNARDQKAMEYGSGTSAHCGFKNTVTGSIEPAVQSSASAHGKHSFIGVEDIGLMCLVRTEGNPTGHLVLRGGEGGVTNYDEASVSQAEDLLREYGLHEAIEIDASHGNSGKKAANQPVVVRAVAEQIASGRKSIVGVQMETNLVEGADPLILGKPIETYGKSLTDECMGPENTELCLDMLNEAAAKRAERHTLSKQKVRIS